MENENSAIMEELPKFFIPYCNSIITVTVKYYLGVTQLGLTLRQVATVERVVVHSDIQLLRATNTFIVSKGVVLENSQIS